MPSNAFFSKDDGADVVVFLHYGYSLASLSDDLVLKKKDR
jgi:hypothetical protein